MQGRDVDWGFRGASLAAKDRGGALQQLGLPLRDLVGVDIVLLGQFGQGLLALEGARATLALKAGVWLRRGRRLIFCS